MTNRETLPHIYRGSQSIPDISVVIVNWNLRDLLRRCLESVKLQGDGVAVETIVVDNGSSDGSAEMVGRVFPEVILIRNSENAGFSRASNQGMQAASGRYLFLLNNDSLLLDGALKRLVAYMDLYPETGVSGPRVINSDGTLQVYSKGYYPSVPRIMGQLFLPEKIKHAWGSSLCLYEFEDKMEIQEFDWLSGCALMARRQAVEEVGLLDAEVFMYCEDVDWCYRMSKSGWRVMYLPQAQVLHYGGQSMRKQSGGAVGAHASGLAAYYSRYHGRAAALVFRMVLGAGYTVRAVGWLVGGLLGRRAGLDKLKRMAGRRDAGSGR